ncbi:MAG: hypothetical protein AAFX09_10175 [Pseudomonadota bacterium]
MDSALVQILVLIISALAIAGLVWLNARLGGWTPARVESLAAARAVLEFDVIGFRAAQGVLAADGRAALFTEDGGERLGLVTALGDGLVSRALGAGDVRAVDRDGAGLKLALNDYTYPAVTLTLADEDEAESWRRAIEALTAAGARQNAVEASA